ncbi:MAG: D-glycero-beta-D-manno-heptose 1,7-bisphosphate 7-phosphatase [Anaerolineales bacterium]
MSNLKPQSPNSHSRRPAVFLDRDGVINENRPGYVRNRAQVRILPGALAALAALAKSPYAIIVVTNQSGVGRGLISHAEANAINEHLSAIVTSNGGRFDSVQLCPHAPDDACDCRKPQPGMLLRAAVELSLDLSVSWMVGDAVSDIRAGLAAGVRPLLVRTGRGAQQASKLLEHGLVDVPVVADLTAAVDHILVHGSPRADG